MELHNRICIGENVMAILWMEGFDNMNGAETILFVNSGFQSTAYTNQWGQSNAALFVNQQMSTQCRLPIFASGSGVSEGGFVLWHWSGFEGTESDRGLVFENYQGDKLFGLDWRAGELAYLYNAVNTQITTTPYSYQLWEHWEIQFKIDNTTGYVVARRNGSQVISQSGLNTHNGGDPEFCQIRIGTHNIGGTNRLFDDFVVYDFSSPNQGWLGYHRIYDTPISQSSTNSDFTRSAGTENYENVDESIPDGDTTYNYSGNTGAKDDFLFRPYSGAANITAVAVSVTALQESVDTTQLNIGIETEGTNVVSGTFDVESVTYKRKTFVVHNNPDDSQPFDTTDLDGLKLTYEIV